MRTCLLALVITAVALGCGGSKKSPTAPAADTDTTTDDTGERDASQPDDADDMPSASSDDPMGDGGE